MWLPCLQWRFLFYKNRQTKNINTNKPVFFRACGIDFRLKCSSYFCENDLYVCKLKRPLPKVAMLNVTWLALDEQLNTSIELTVKNIGIISELKSDFSAIWLVEYYDVIFTTLCSEYTIFNAWLPPWTKHPFKSTKTDAVISLIASTVRSSVRNLFFSKLKLFILITTVNGVNSDKTRVRMN